MESARHLSFLGRLIGDPARASILDSLLDGSSHTAGDLAVKARISPQSASGHLSKLLKGRFPSVTVDGRRRLYRLAGRHVAVGLERFLAAIPQEHPVQPGGLTPFLYVRSCYDHLAGAVAVKLASSLLERRVLEAGRQELILTHSAEALLRDLGINLALLRNSRRKFAPKCLDWSEKRPHIGGSLGAAFLQSMLNNRWIARLPHERALRLTPVGKAGFRKYFMLDV